MEDWQANQTARGPAPALYGLAKTSGTIPADPAPPHLRQLAEVLIESGALQRPALARRIGVSKQTVSELLSVLEQRGLVRVAGPLNGLPGRSSLSYALRPEAALALGFDIGGTKIAAALIDLRGTVLAETIEPTAHGDLDQLVGQLAGLATALTERAGAQRLHVQACTVGVPAAVNPATGILNLAANLPGLVAVDLHARLTAALGCPVAIENDVNLALLGEVAAGCGKGKSDIAFVALGTGVGAGLMVNGRLLRGATGGAGEIAYLPLPDHGTTERSLIQGHFETVVGEAGIREAFVRRGGAADLPVRAIFDAAAAGDARALETIDELAGHVALGIVSLIALIDPELVVLGGSVGARPELIERVRHQLATRFERPVPILASNTGARAGLAGALETARRHLLADLFGEE
ncbi:sugar kinase [Devosia yakushimensis]|uniref:Sugar kinase n=1 Tax=Devosia yakushimensis TaxID=470028 RepID=A0ABQ5UJK1_9HYPH|nr:ROK family transcriptional regulator [Devosia yakushimensis]GLQ11358.1 sugar kinase [Devosia yakushimensis]